MRRFSRPLHCAWTRDGSICSCATRTVPVRARWCTTCRWWLTMDGRSTQRGSRTYTTTLYVTVREGDASGPVIAKGIVNIHIKDFRKQLTTMKAVGAASKLEELKTLAKFGRFFMGAMNEV